MSNTRAIAHNTIVQIIGKGISTIIGVVVVGLLTRYLGEAGFGQYTIVMAYLQLFGILVDMGLYVILVKRISEPGIDADAVASNILTLRLISAVVFLGLAPLVILFFDYPSIVKMGVLITTLSFFGITLNQVLSGIFQKHMRMDKVVIAEVVGRIVLVAGTYGCVVLDLNLLWILAVVSVSSLVNFMMTYVFSRQFIRLRLRFDWEVWRSVIRDAWPIALSIGFNLLYFKTDVLFLSHYQGDAAVGLYGAANKVLEVLVTFPAMFAGLVLPLLTAAWVSGDRERFRGILQKSYDAMLMVALPLIVGTMLLADPIMHLVAPEFSASPDILRLLIVATGIIFVGNLFGNTVVALNRQRATLWLYGAIAGIALVGYMVAIPAHSYYGAAVVRIVAEFLITLSMISIVGITSKVWPRFGTMAKVVVACAAMGAVIFILRDAHVLLAIIGGVIAYGVGLLVMRAVTTDTIREIISIRR
ncbi:MAG: flippase [Candidatus Kerfeldbacteria bacterium]|nr:flippase [Candidatus Kerfeldbacteria bacterium]